MAEVINIFVYKPSTYTRTVPDEIQLASGSNDIWPFVTEFQLEEHRAEADELSLSVYGPSEWFTPIVLVNIRYRLYVEYDDGSVKPFRVTSFNRTTGKGDDVKLQARSLDADLADLAFRYYTDPGFADTYKFSFSQWAVEDILTTLFSSQYGMEATFDFEEIEATLRDLVITIYANNSYFLELLRVISDEVARCHGLTFEYEAAFNDASGVLAFSFFEEAGWSEDERLIGAADPSLRPIETPTGGVDLGVSDFSEGNRITARFAIEDADLVTRLIPFGGTSEEDKIGIGGTVWTATVAGSTVIFDDEPITVDGAYASAADDLVFHLQAANGATYQILTSTAPSTVTVSGSPTGQSEFIIIATRGEAPARFDGNVSFVHHPFQEAVFGVIERFVTLDEVRPYDNLLEDQYTGSATLSLWVSGLPVGWEALGAATVTEVTSSLYVIHGTSSARVSGDTDEGLCTSPVFFEPSARHPYLSAWTALRVEQGRVKLYFEDLDGARHPDVADWELGADDVYIVQFGGTEPVEGDGRLCVACIEDDTVFYLDAATITRSVGPWAYSPSMGQKALWRAAGELLNQESARFNEQFAAFETEYIPLDHFDSATYEAVRAGSWVRLRDLYDDASGGILTSDGRVETVRTVVRRSGGDGLVKQFARVERRRRSIGDRLAATGIRGPSSSVNRLGEPAYPSAPITHNDIGSSCDLCSVAYILPGETSVNVDVSIIFAELPATCKEEGFETWQVQLTPITGPDTTTPADWFWVDDIFSGSFVIAVDVAPTDLAIGFAWRASPCGDALAPFVFTDFLYAENQGTVVTIKSVPKDVPGPSNATDWHFINSTTCLGATDGAPQLVYDENTKNLYIVEQSWGAWRFTPIGEGGNSCPPLQVLVAGDLDVDRSATFDTKRNLFVWVKAAGDELWACEPDGTDKRKLFTLALPVGTASDWRPFLTYWPEVDWYTFISDGGAGSRHWARIDPDTGVVVIMWNGFTTLNENPYLRSDLQEFMTNDLTGADVYDYSELPATFDRTINAGVPMARPRWHPDDEKFYFVNGTLLRRCNADGSTVETVFNMGIASADVLHVNL